ncbi:MAG TPA: hypothetical protein VFH74_06915 [Gaiellales bacterium]|nr:hypothetical protein [Gaiellales bacterium]
MARRVHLLVAVAALVAGGATGMLAGCSGGHSAATGHPPSRADSGAPPATTAAPQVKLRAPRPFPGFLLVADRGNDRALLLDGRKRILWRYPRPGRSPAMPFAYDDDTFFGPGYRTIVSNQEDQETVQVLAFPAGRLLWRYGHVDAVGSGPGYLDNPDDAYLLPSGRVTVADTRNCRVLVLSRSRHIVRQYGRAGVCAHDPPHLLSSPNGDTPLADGGMLISEIGGSWIDDISATGRLRWAVQAPIAYPSDAQMLPDGRILVADYSRPGHVIVMTRRGTVVWKYGPPSGPGMLDHPSLALRLPNGLIAVNDDYRDRVVIIDPATHRIVWQYGHTDVPGRRHGFLNTPDGMDFLPTSAVLSHPQIERLVRRSLVSR